MLLYVEDPGDANQEEALNVEVTGDSFAWYFEYDNGIESTSRGSESPQTSESGSR